MLNGSVAYHTFVYPLDRAYDRVLRCLGWQFDPSPFAAAGLGGTPPTMMPMAKLAAGAKLGHAQGGGEDGDEVGGGDDGGGGGGSNSTDVVGTEVEGAPAAAAEAEAEVDDADVLLSGLIEMKVGRKWKKKWAELLASPTAGGTLRVRRPRPDSDSRDDGTTAAAASSLPPVELSLAVDAVGLREAERALDGPPCSDHKNCAEFARLAGLKLRGDKSKDCELNAKELWCVVRKWILGCHAMLFVWRC